jgi:hypothetical protein
MAAADDFDLETAVGLAVLETSGNETVADVAVPAVVMFTLAREALTSI